MSRTNSGSPIRAGGGRASQGIGERLQPDLHRVLQSSDSLLYRREEFRALVKAAAHSLRCYCVNDKERTRCDNISQGHALSFDGLELLCTLAARSEKPWCLEEMVRGAVVQRAIQPPTLCALEASREEEASNGPLNLAQLTAVEEDTAVRWEAVAEFAAAQKHASSILADASLIRARRLA